ncbi:MAG: hypothetical protein ABFR82_03500 [Nitrospirota bacterium]
MFLNQLNIDKGNDRRNDNKDSRHNRISQQVADVNFDSPKTVPAGAASVRLEEEFERIALLLMNTRNSDFITSAFRTSVLDEVF